MKLVGVTQRVSIEARTAERRDCLDQRWAPFLTACGLLPVPLPNVADAALAICRQVPIAGIVLTGGNDLVDYGGDAPERDRTENLLVEHAERIGLPVMGVCRGMQVLQHRQSIPLTRIEGHVTPRQSIRVDGERRWVNSYHRFGSYGSVPSLTVWGIADDGVVKAVRHDSHPIAGVMWHPEREPRISPEDVRLFKEFFGGSS
jgi:N5-(cytidine 5'-diphosphoramidyl)-L-glutamine hydrolase